METVQFQCPHCEGLLEGSVNMNGQTLPCPYCHGLVTLEVSITKRVAADAVGGLLVGLLAAFLDN